MRPEEAEALRSRILAGELIHPYEYGRLLELIDDLFDLREQVEGQHIALLQMKKLLRESAPSPENRIVDRDSLDRIVVALRYCEEQISRRGWDKWSEGLEVTVHGAERDIVIIMTRRG